jgi:acyl dehydratase
VRAEGPYFDDLSVGQVFRGAPSVSLTEGLAAAHQAVVGNRLALTLDTPLSEAVVGGPLASPALVWDIAIGQSTLATHHVKANLFYRGLTFRRAPVTGDTLRTLTRVEGLRQNRPRPDRRPTGLAALHITTVDQHGEPVLDFWRCAMLPLRAADIETGREDDLDAIGAGAAAFHRSAIAGWNLAAFRDRCLGPTVGDLTVGTTIDVVGGDVVSSAPGLARLTLNVAQVHHDADAAGGRRLVYGGHTIGLALTQATRALPSIVTVLGWHGCDHLAPVHEDDTVRSTVTIEAIDRLEDGGVVHLRSQASVEDRPVLDWRFLALVP